MAPRPLTCQMHVRPGVTSSRRRSSSVYRATSRHRRPGPDKGHVPFEDAPQLGQFVDAQLAHDPADPGDAGVVLHFECDAVPVIVNVQELVFEFFRVHDHGAEFRKRELLPPTADARLPEQDGSAVRQLDQQADDQKEGGQEHQQEDGAEGVDGGFPPLRTADARKRAARMRRTREPFGNLAGSFTSLDRV